MEAATLDIPRTADRPAPAPAAPRRRLPIDLDFLLLAMLLVVNHAPFVTPRVQPANDTVYVFQIFHYFYADFLTAGDLARWLPYGMYGVPATFDQVICLSPACYLVGLAGGLAGATDTLLLLKTAFLLEKFVFLAGLYLLTRCIYATRLARLLICGTAVLTLVWVYNLWWDWRIFYLLPLQLHLLVQFFRQERPVYLWLTGLAYLASLPGSLIYFAPVTLLILTAVAGVLTLDRPRAWWCLLTLSGANLLGLAACLVLAAVYGWMTVHSLDGIASLAHGRDLTTGRVPVEEFLNYGPRVNREVFTALLTGWPAYADNTHYVGLLPLFCAAWGLFHVRTPVFWALLSAALLLTLLSLGGTTARLAYHFPLMDIFRHTGLLYGPVKVLLLLAGGCGLDALLQRLLHPGPHPPAAAFPLARLPLLLLLAAVPLDLWAAAAYRDLENHWGVQPLTAADVNLLLVAGRFLLYALLAAGLAVLGRTGRLARAPWRTGAAAAVALVLLADAGSFLGLTHLVTPRLSRRSAEEESVRAGPLAFREQRLDDPYDPAACAALHRYTYPRPRLSHPFYTMAYNFLQVDPPYPRFRTDQLSREALTLLQLRAAHPRQWPEDDWLPPEDDWLLDALGVTGPKLRVTRDVRPVPPAALHEAVRALPPSSRAVVLPLAEAEAPVPSDMDTSPAGDCDVLHFSANALVVKARVTGGRDAWLYYADGWHRDWRCTVNGRSAAVLRANVGFKAVRLAPGASEVRFTFNGGRRYPLSLALAALGLLLAVAGLVVSAAPLRRAP